MTDVENAKSENLSLLDAVVGLLNSQREGNIDFNTLVSLLTLCNLLGIISFLNNQVGLNLNLNSPGTGKSLDKTSLASSLLSLINSPGTENKISPQMLMPLLKVLSPTAEEKTQAKSRDDA